MGQSNKLVVVVDLLILAGVSFFSWYLATDYQTFSGRVHMPIVIWIIDTVDLFMHEGGHFFFGFMGRLIYFMGGSLMQIVLPSLAVWVFLKSGFRMLIATMYWLGQNLINVSVYIGDAPNKRLPLISDSAIHDWNWIFNHLGNIGMAEPVSSVAFVFGLIACACTVIIAGYFTVTDFLVNFLTELD